MTFIFEPLVQFIEVTQAYSNAVLLAVMPHVSDFAVKMQLPLPLPLTTNQVSRFVPRDIKSDVGGTFFLTNGTRISFSHGYVEQYESPHSFTTLQDPDEMKHFHGKLNVDKKGAIAIARNTIEKLGYDLDTVFARLDPFVEPLQKDKNSIIPVFDISWKDPRGGTAVEVEVNADTKTVEYFSIFSWGLARPGPTVSVIPPIKEGFGSVNPEYGRALFSIVLTNVTEFVKKLNLPIALPLTTNEIESFYCSDNDGTPHSELKLKNGYRFIYRNDGVNGFYSPSNFYNSDKQSVKLSDFEGKVKLSDAKAVEIAREWMGKSGFPESLTHVSTEPTIQKPFVAPERIPRVLVDWKYPKEKFRSWAVVEVNTETGGIASLYFDCATFSKRKPNIDLPIAAVSENTGK
jgi:hypothetical protein